MKRIIFIIGIVCAVWSVEVNAAHIIGGEVTYKCLGIDTFQQTFTIMVTFTMYRDAGGEGADFDFNAEFGVFNGEFPNWNYMSSVVGKSPTTIDLIQNEELSACLIFPPDIFVEKGVYEFELALPISDQSYMITYQRCCRNNTINNIWQPDETGAAFNVSISPIAQQTCNNSPIFDKFPPTVICLNEPLDFDHSATDAEGDQLVYEFCAPLQAGGQVGTSANPGDSRSCAGVRPDPSRCPPPYEEVIFRLPTYSKVNPMGGAPRVTIDPQTGFISGVPNIQGQFVVGVCVKEYRNGLLLGELRRDFQFNVAQCENVIVAKVEADAVISDKNYQINSCGEQTITFENESYNINNIHSYDWSFTSGNTHLSSSDRNAVITFPNMGRYDGFMVVNKDSECPDTAHLQVNIYPSITADFSFDYDTCLSGPVAFTDLSQSDAGPIVDWQWNFGDGNSENVTDAAHRYKEPGDFLVNLTVMDDNLCESTIEKSISYQPVPALIVVEPTSFIGCSPAQIFFNNLSSPVDEDYAINWDFGDGNTSQEISPSHIYRNTGIYSVKVDITSPVGCSIAREYPHWITVEPSPTAQYSFTPEMPTVFNREVQFIDESIDASGWLWQFGGSGVSTERNPSWNFPDTGIFATTLIVTNDQSCTDTLTRLIDVSPFVSLHMPNAFTPNHDGKNDEFQGIGVNDNISDYKMLIYTRWGEEIFSSEDPSIGWNGRRNNTGEDAPSGIYVYTVQFKTPRGKQEVRKGHVTVVR